VTTAENFSTILMLRCSVFILDVYGICSIPVVIEALLHFLFRSGLGIRFHSNPEGFIVSRVNHSLEIPSRLTWQPSWAAVIELAVELTSYYLQEVLPCEFGSEPS